MAGKLSEHPTENRQRHQKHEFSIQEGSAKSEAKVQQPEGKQARDLEDLWAHEDSPPPPKHASLI